MITLNFAKCKVNNEVINITKKNNSNKYLVLQALLLFVNKLGLAAGFDKNGELLEPYHAWKYITNGEEKK